jgi:hypothetical protein
LRHSIVGHGRRSKQAHDQDHDWISVRRGRCQPCHQTFTFLPPFSLPYTHFYEKVVKVKADVAAILKFFSPARSIPQIEADHLDAAPVAPIGGMRKGGFSGAL